MIHRDHDAHAFITKWRSSELKELSASQEQFIDLGRLLGGPTPADGNPATETYRFERGARGIGPGSGPLITSEEGPESGPTSGGGPNLPHTEFLTQPLRVCPPFSSSTHARKT